MNGDDEWRMAQPKKPTRSAGKERGCSSSLTLRVYWNEDPFQAVGVLMAADRISLCLPCQY